ncbi:MAG: hypothetical protein QOH04_1784 [Sphingomonadales bacterium]|jgi:hypothetical protein|nr:hypothetical protein [Sphingomonadales bacterium]MEA3036019.1 hypothetical protein [Sphingomonadales bacterium]
MLEGLEARAEALAARRLAEARSALAAALREEAPRGVRVEERPEGVALVGRGLMRRSLIDPALRWLVERTRG